MASCLTTKKVDMEDEIIKWLERVREGVIFNGGFLAYPEKALHKALEGKGISTGDGEISDALNSLLQKGEIRLCIYQSGEISFYLRGSDREKYNVCLLHGSFLD